MYFISNLCKRFEENSKSFSLIYVHREFSTKTPFLHLLPPILIWAPVEQFNEVFPGGFLCPKCDSSSVLHGYGWMNGADTDRSEPRKIHGRDGITILVGRVYKCVKSGHDVVSYHPGILRQIKAKSLIPFRVWSRTGFTYDLMNDIEAMMISGVSSSMIETNLATSPVAQYAERKNRYLYLQKLLLLIHFPHMNSAGVHIYQHLLHLDIQFLVAFLHHFGRKDRCLIHTCSAQLLLMKIHGSHVIILLLQ